MWLWMERLSGCGSRRDRSHRYDYKDVCFELQKMYLHLEIFKQRRKVDVGWGYRMEERESQRESTGA